MAEARDREFAQKALRDRERADAFGNEGVKLVDKADAAVERIVSSEAAREGWLGDPEELGFESDLAMIAESLRRATAIRNVMAESSAIPNPTDIDAQMLKDARGALRRLDKSVRERVKLLAECADEAELIDRKLRDEREEARVAEQRDDVRSRLNAMLYGVESSPTSASSDSADAVKARVSAFRELKGLLDEERLRGPSADVTEVEAPPDGSAAGRGLMRRIQRIWSD